MMTGSGRPFAIHTKVTLLPSFTVTSEDMLEIFGGTTGTKMVGQNCLRLIQSDIKIVLKDSEF